MLTKIYLGNVNIINKRQLIEQLQHAVEIEEKRGPKHKRLDQGIALILSPTWYAEYATVANIYSIPGSDMLDAQDNDALQCYQVFLKGNGSFSMDKEFSEVMIDCWNCEGEGTKDDEPCPTCDGTGKIRDAEEDPE